MLKKIHQNIRIQSIYFGGKSDYSKKDLNNIAEAISKSSPLGIVGLEGRVAIKRVTLSDETTLVIKQYIRGGLIKYFNKKYYIRFGPSRSEREYRCLSLAKKYGVNVPTPLLFMEKGRLFYQSWLATEEIPNSITLAQLSFENSSRAKQVLPALAEQVAILIRHGIFHVDFHPGNVIVDANNKVFLLDFDKAKIGQRKKELLCNKYNKRWKRAILKHQLPEWLLGALGS